MVQFAVRLAVGTRMVHAPPLAAAAARPAPRTGAPLRLARVASGMGGTRRRPRSNPLGSNHLRPRPGGASDGAGAPMPGENWLTWVVRATAPRPTHPLWAAQADRPRTRKA